MMNLGMLSAGRGLLRSPPGRLGGGMPATGMALAPTPGGGWSNPMQPPMGGGMFRTGVWNPSGAPPMQNPVMPVVDPAPMPQDPRFRPGNMLKPMPQVPMSPVGTQQNPVMPVVAPGTGTQANPYLLGRMNFQKGIGAPGYAPRLTPWLGRGIHASATDERDGSRGRGRRRYGTIHSAVSSQVAVDGAATGSAGPDGEHYASGGALALAKWLQDSYRSSRTQ
jgi:hypothetical protein